MYPADKYPNYVQGVAYLMSTYVAKKIYYESLQNNIIHLEDVFITGMDNILYCKIIGYRR